MITRFIADLHFGHRNVISFDNRPFSSIEEMDKYIISKWNSVVQPEDTTYILGDISYHYESRTMEILNELQGTKILIKGNHDRNWNWHKRFYEVYPSYHEIKLDNNFIVLSHYPIHFFNKHYYDAYMFYGHVHNSKEWYMVEEYKRYLEAKDIKCNMFNVGCMMPYIDYTPKTFEEIINGNMDGLIERNL